MPQEARVALVDGSTLQEIFIERRRAKGIAGNIYKGRVTRVVPGMQAAFVDLGLEKAAFLHASDLPSAAVGGGEELDDSVGPDDNGTARRAPLIEEALRKDNEI